MMLIPTTTNNTDAAAGAGRRRGRAAAAAGRAAGGREGGLPVADSPRAREPVSPPAAFGPCVGKPRRGALPKP